MSNLFPVVLLTYHFPPTAEVGGIRAANVARAFLDAGHPVIVVCAPSADHGTASPLAPHPALKVNIAVPDRSPREWYARAKQWLLAPVAGRNRGSPSRQS